LVTWRNDIRPTDRGGAAGNDVPGAGAAGGVHWRRSPTRCSYMRGSGRWQAGSHSRRQAGKSSHMASHCGGRRGIAGRRQQAEVQAGGGGRRR